MMQTIDVNKIPANAKSKQAISHLIKSDQNKKDDEENSRPGLEQYKRLRAKPINELLNPPEFVPLEMLVRRITREEMDRREAEVIERHDYDSLLVSYVALKLQEYSHGAMEGPLNIDDFI